MQLSKQGNYEPDVLGGVVTQTYGYIRVGTGLPEK